MNAALLGFLLPTLIVGIGVSSTADARTNDARVSVIGHSVIIHTEIVVYGKNATAAEASAVRENILKNWQSDSYGNSWTFLEKRSGVRYEVFFDVTVSLYYGLEKQQPQIIPGAWNPMNRRNYINLSEVPVRSNVYAGDEGRWYPGHPNTYAHEFGHLLGLTDRYHVSKDGYSDSDRGWESNLMADSTYGRVEQRNIDAIVRPIVLRRLLTNADFKTEIDNPFMLR